MNRITVVGICLLVVSGCSFMVKTPIVADYEKLNQLGQSTTRNDIEVMLGSPQGVGSHIYKSSMFDLTFYYGMAGRFSAKKANIDSGTAFVTYDGDEVRHAMYFLSDFDGPEVRLGHDLPISSLARQLSIEESSIGDLYKVLGTPPFIGRRIDNKNKLTHRAAYWDASEIKDNAAIHEKWLVVGFDNKNIVQDIIWVSSDPSEVRQFGSLVEQKYTKLGILKPAGFIPYYDVQSIVTTSPLDPTQVEALLERRPSNVQDYVDVLGKPTALGLKKFKGEDPLILSNWSFSTIQNRGVDKNYVLKDWESKPKPKVKPMPGSTRPPGPDDFVPEKRPSFHVIEISQGRLMIAHDETGVVREVLWFKPE